MGACVRCYHKSAGKSVKSADGCSRTSEVVYWTPARAGRGAETGVPVRLANGEGRSSLCRMVSYRPAVNVAAAILLPIARRGIIMSDLSSPGPESTGPPKPHAPQKVVIVKPVSPVRNVIGLIVLVVVVVVGGLEVWAKMGYNSAVKSLDARSQDETKGLLAVDEAESLFRKSPDGPGIDSPETHQTFTRKTYTWRGLINSYTLTAYYTKGADPRLHHFETDGAKFQPEPITRQPNPSPPALAKVSPPSSDPGKEKSKTASGTATKKSKTASGTDTEKSKTASGTDTEKSKAASDPGQPEKPKTTSDSGADQAPK